MLHRCGTLAAAILLTAVAPGNAARLTLVQDGEPAAVIILGKAPNPVAFEAAHQIGSLWHGHHTGWLAVPQGARRWWVRARAPLAPLRLIAHDAGGGLRICVEDADGVALIAEGVQLARAAPWPDDADLAAPGEVGSA